MAENVNAIEVRDITKSFKVYLDKGSQLKERLLFRKRCRYEERKVLRGISFDVKKGEAIGQGVFMKYLLVDNDDATNERTGGFGSTDKK